MATKVTIQDIASELQLSRNTVSKAINNTGVLADATREKILRKAAEMGYKQFAYLPLFQEDAAKTAGPFILPSAFIWKTALRSRMQWPTWSSTAKNTSALRGIKTTVSPSLSVIWLIRMQWSTLV